MQTYADISDEPWSKLDLWLVSNCVPTYYLTQHWGMKNIPVLLRFLAENRFTKQSGKFGSNLDRVGCSWFLSKNQICRLGHATPSVFWACNLLQQNGPGVACRFIPSAAQIPTQRWYQLPAREYSRRELIADRLVNFGGFFGVSICTSAGSCDLPISIKICGIGLTSYYCNDMSDM